ncbi:MAG: maleylpyruvate isomerase N-terminal domain-containing protein [Ilumatobacteraceae bacterium]
MSRSDDEVLGLLAAAVAARPPDRLGGVIVDAARVARPAGQAVESLGGGRAANPAEAFVQTVDEFASLLTNPGNGAIVEPYGWSVTQLVAHLVEVDLYLGRQLGLWQHEIDERIEHDHLAMTEVAVREAMRADFAETVARWSRVSAELCSNVSLLDSDGLRRRIKFHMLETRVSTVLVARIFEVWTHIEDLCRALRCDAPQLDAGRLHLMTRAAVAAIPLGMLLAQIDGGQNTARIVLTGRGGGVWNQSLQFGGQAAEPSVTIVADAVDFCRLAAQRIAPTDLAAEVEGSMDLAIEVLRGASVFAA